MSHSHLIANELHKVGFQTKVLASNAVKVSLSNRKPSTMEVEYVLEQLFEGIPFTVKSFNGVLVVMELSND